MLRLTLLAPWVVEAIMEGRQVTEMTLPVLMKPFALDWAGQRIKGEPNESTNHAIGLARKCDLI